MGAQILSDLGIREMTLLTNRARAIKGLEGFGLSVVERRPIDQLRSKVKVPDSPHIMIVESPYYEEINNNMVKSVLIELSKVGRYLRAL